MRWRVTRPSRLARGGGHRSGDNASPLAFSGGVLASLLLGQRVKRACELGAFRAFNTRKGIAQRAADVKFWMAAVNGNLNLF